MTATTTTLPLFWHLSSANRSERIDASVKLVAALQQFQEKQDLKRNENSSSGKENDKDEEESDVNEEEEDVCSAKLDSDNAPDVAYAIRRLIRGLASPRESSRLGFAVALTELFSRINSVTCEQILVLLKNASQTSGSMSGQEERDMLFARLFGLKSVVQSGLLFKHNPLRSSSTSSSSLKGFEYFLTELLELGEKKSWLRESCWWTLISVVDALSHSSIPWKEGSYDMLLDRVYTSDKSWSPEKVALTLKLQRIRRAADWESFCGSYFKNSHILSTSNLSLLGRLLKASITEDVSEDETVKHTSGPWKPQLHFVWDVILDTLLTADSRDTSSGNFQDFYRIVVDETLFASSSSPQRKYWGFLVFQMALHRLPTASLSMLFTTNFMRTWINQLSKNDRYLHKIARQVASDVQQVVEKDPKAGFTLVMQLVGTNGSFHFDRITKTKTVETILASMDSTGIKEYIAYLLKQVNEEEQGDSLASVDARRTWIVDQLATLVKKGSIPKTDEILSSIIDWFTTHAFFKVVKKSSKSSNVALHRVPEPPFSDELRNICRSKLLSCLADLTSASTTVEVKDGKSLKLPGVASDGEFWISKTLKTIVNLEKDSKHASSVRQSDGQELETRNRVFSVIEKMKESTTNREVACGTELLVSALTLRCICEDDPEEDWEGVRECTDQVARLFVSVGSSKAERKKMTKLSESEDDDEGAPIDLIVDIIIGLLEHSSSFTRIIANQSFGMLSSMVTDSTVDLILAQLERRDPTDDVVDADTETNDDTNDSMQSDEEDSKKEKDDESDSGSGDDEKEEDLDDEDAEALRKALPAAVSGKETGTDGDESDGSSGEVYMDDDQMMAIDEKLAAVFRTRAEEHKKGKDTGAQREATYFKNRVLDLIETYMKRQPLNGLVLRFILPLVELVATASSDEKQLSDKAKGILRSRLSKMKDAAPISDPSKGVELLESLHLRARKARSQEMVSTISMCCLFITKALSNTDDEEVLRIYKESITDFITRKTSPLNAAFIIDFVRRHPILAWSIRSHVTGALSSATNGYRQSQAFNILQTVVTSFPQAESSKDEILSFMPEVSRAFLDAVNKSCGAEKPLMNSVHIKDSLKIALSLCRFSRRLVADLAAFEKAWMPEAWESLASALSTSDNFKSSPSTVNTCQQISKLVRSGKTSNGAPSTKASRKRKQGIEGQSVGEDDSGNRKPKRKKVRKIRTVENS